MARKCTCAICKNKGTTDIFYRVDDGKKVKYYCNENEYMTFILEKEKRMILLDYIANEILELAEGQIINPIMIKKISELKKFYDYEVILESFKLNKGNIHYWMNNKDFSNEYGMISYIMKIIEGSINDVYKKWKKQQEHQVKYENNYLEIDLDVMNNLPNVNAKSNTTGIQSFLDEDDM